MPFFYGLLFRLTVQMDNSKGKHQVQVASSTDWFFVPWLHLPPALPGLGSQKKPRGQG